LGPFANQVALADPNRAHAVARLRGADQIDVSVRAPLLRRTGADRLCARFGGGGRAAAAAIEALPAARFEEFVQALKAVSWGESAA
jgi:nanoRNase/pAp phosphatase (c-di-AMP/oligoRNAs hydrolase)